MVATQQQQQAAQAQAVTQQAQQQAHAQQLQMQGGQQPQQQQNTQIIRTFMAAYFQTHPIKREDIPTIGGKPIDLTKLFSEVYAQGGFERVSLSIF